MVRKYVLFSEVRNEYVRALDDNKGWHWTRSLDDATQFSDRHSAETFARVFDVPADVHRIGVQEGGAS